MYYRLNVVPLFIPPLRKRIEDIPLLVEHLIKKYNQEYGRSVEKISDDALKILMKFDWPGNVRELENVISRAMIKMKFTDNIIMANHLPIFEDDKLFQNNKHIIYFNSKETKEDIYQNKTLKEVIEDKEKELIQYVLEKTNGNKTLAAKRLGIATRSLYYKLDKYRL